VRLPSPSRFVGRLMGRPSPQHEALAFLIPRLREARDLDSVDRERTRLERWHATLDRSLPTSVVPLFSRRFSVVTEELDGFPSYTITPRGVDPSRTILYLHGGGFVAPIDAFHVRYATRLATALKARIVMPDYPLAPEHTWKTSYDALVAMAARWSAEGPLVLAGDSAGGGIALALALGLRDDSVPLDQLLLIAPWVDLTTSTPDTEHYSASDPWLKLGKLRAYAEFWAGGTADLALPQVSPALADLTGLPPALMFCGTRDTLYPACRLLAERAAAAGWELTFTEQPDLIHAYPLLPFVPEARRAWAETMSFLGT
jgi:monoterpene epsilon-lactone hydrolase